MTFTFDCRSISQSAIFLAPPRLALRPGLPQLTFHLASALMGMLDYTAEC